MYMYTYMHLRVRYWRLESRVLQGWISHLCGNVAESEVADYVLTGKLNGLVSLHHTLS